MPGTVIAECWYRVARPDRRDSVEQRCCCDTDKRQEGLVTELAYEAFVVSAIAALLGFTPITGASSATARLVAVVFLLLSLFLMAFA